LCALVVSCAHAAPGPVWPTKPVRLVIGWPPAGGTDTIARLMAAHLAKSWGHQVVVDNRPGAGGGIGALTVVRAEPDGYTLLFATAAEMTIAPVTVKTMHYNPLEDLQPISLIGRGPYMLVASSSFPPNTLSELIAYAKANPAKVNYASFGYGTIGHMLGELLKTSAAINTVHVPYKGSAQAITDLVGGQVQYAFVTPLAGLVMVKAGKLKAIAVATPQRLANADAIPTMSEAGLPGFVGGSWYGLLAPAKTPMHVVDRVNREVVAALNQPEMRKSFGDHTILPESSTPDGLSRIMQSDIAKFRKLAAEIGIKPE
jgi:tripartite-type tricarboxylate transporter receptor subunit TctC